MIVRIDRKWSGLVFGEPFGTGRMVALVEVLPAARLCLCLGELQLMVRVEPMISRAWGAHELLRAITEGDQRFRLVNVAPIPAEALPVDRN